MRFLSDIGLRSLGEEGCDKVASRGCRIRVHLDLEKPRKVHLIAFKPLFDQHPPRWHLGAAEAAMHELLLLEKAQKGGMGSS